MGMFLHKMSAPQDMALGKALGMALGMALAAAQAWASAWQHRLLLHRGSLQRHHHLVCQPTMIRRSASVEDTCWDLRGLRMSGSQYRLYSE